MSKIKPKYLFTFLMTLAVLFLLEHIQGGGFIPPFLNPQPVEAVTYGVKLAASSTPKQKPTGTYVAVKRIIDGDTIELVNGKKVRYIGVNAPESVDPRRKVQCFGKEAAAYNAKLVLNERVRLVKDVSDTDKYGRLLRYVYLPDGTLVNERLVRDGFASVMTIPPDVAKSELFVQAGRQAREEKLGLWKKCRK